MYLETWLKAFCPGCGKPNWLCLGNLEDPTGFPAPDGLTCHSCLRSFDLDGLEQEPEACNFGEGRRRPGP